MNWGLETIRTSNASRVFRKSLGTYRFDSFKYYEQVWNRIRRIGTWITSQLKLVTVVERYSVILLAVLRPTTLSFFMFSLDDIEFVVLA